MKDLKFLPPQVSISQTISNLKSYIVYSGIVTSLTTLTGCQQVLERLESDLKMVVKETLVKDALDDEKVVNQATIQEAPQKTLKSIDTDSGRKSTSIQMRSNKSTAQSQMVAMPKTSEQKLLSQTMTPASAPKLNQTQKPSPASSRRPETNQVQTIDEDGNKLELSIGAENRKPRVIIVD